MRFFSILLATLKENIVRICFATFAIGLISLYTYEAVLLSIRKTKEGWHGVDTLRVDIIEESVWPAKGNLKHKVWLHYEELKTLYEKNPHDTAVMKKYADFLLTAHRGGHAIPIYEKITESDPARSDIHLKLFVLYSNFGQYKRLEKYFFGDPELLDKIKDAAYESPEVDSIITHARRIVLRKKQDNNLLRDLD